MNTILYTASELANAINEKLHNCADGSLISGVQFDSRLVEAGDVFFALTVDGADGHGYAVKAIERGASLAVVERVPEGLENLPFCLVKNSLQALEALGVYARNRSAAKRIAITGSVGKTSTKDMLAHVLSDFGQTHAAKASYNNHIGVPLTLARMAKDTEFGVFEIGMNHANEITPLSQFVQPNIAIITAVEPVHIENLGSIEAIAHAKAEIFDGLASNGIAILNIGTNCFEIVQKAAQNATKTVLSYSANAHNKADATILHMELHAECSTVSARINGVELVYKIGAAGAHFVHNSLAVLLCVNALGLDLAQAAMRLASFTPPKGRGVKFSLNTPSGEIFIIDESYNANPASMRAAMNVLALTPVPNNGRRIAVLGHMLELGDITAHAHMELLEPLQNAGVNLVFCAGKHMQHLWDILPASMRGAYSETAAGVEQVLFANLRGGDVVLLKGSNGSKIWQIVESFKTNFG